jgi:IclR family pca regulon transcriptional regulator
LRDHRHRCAVIAQASVCGHDGGMAIAKADFIEGMAKGMAVLESFDTERQRLNATLAAQRAGITRAAARRHLLTLAHLGYLETDGSHFWLAPKVLRFSGSYLASRAAARTLCSPTDCTSARAYRGMRRPPAACCWRPRRRPSSTPG